MSDYTTTVIQLDEPAGLYRQYQGQSEPQPAYIELDLRTGTVLATYDSEVGNAVPFSVRHGFERRYGIPRLTAKAANRVMDELMPLADRILADWEEVWDGNNHVARLGDDARAAEDEIEKALGLGSDSTDSYGPFDEADQVAVWDIDGAVNGSEADDYDITADTTDERLDEIAAEITRDLANISDSKVAVVNGLEEYLQNLRDQLIEDATAPMSDAEFRVLRESLGLTGDWLADHLGVSSRTVRHWEQGKYDIPLGVARALRALETETAAAAADLTAEMTEAYATGPVPEVTVYRTDEDYLATNPTPRRTASWHRAMVARVAQQTTVVVTYDA
ncbi:helix-turn-helix domain-containing protein [Streptomyces sp. NPDC004031]